MRRINDPNWERIRDKENKTNKINSANVGKSFKLPNIDVVRVFRRIEKKEKRERGSGNKIVKEVQFSLCLVAQSCPTLCCIP